MAEFTRRLASLNDLQEIWRLLRDIASDVPFDAKSAAAQESMLSEVMACCTSGLSPVAIDQGGGIAGALLVRRDDFEWGLRNSGAVHISGAAIARDSRDQNVLSALLTDLQARKAAIFASVKGGEQLGLADGLKEAGFEHECAAASGWGDLYQWRPAADA
jgi:hypothetical protein